jgi:tetraacyldisaccharide 4'-kinase
LRSLGLDVVEHPFPDHHQFDRRDLQITHADAILMTEKDAVKCFAFAPENAWYLPVKAEIQSELGEKVLEKIAKVKDGR